MAAKQHQPDHGLSDIRSSCGNGGIANKGLRKPNPNRFHKRETKDLAPATSLRALADAMYREDHGG